MHCNQKISFKICVLLELAKKKNPIGPRSTDLQIAPSHQGDFQDSIERRDWDSVIRGTGAPYALIQNEADLPWGVSRSPLASISWMLPLCHSYPKAPPKKNMVICFLQHSRLLPFLTGVFEVTRPGAGILNTLHWGNCELDLRTPLTTTMLLSHLPSLSL